MRIQILILLALLSMSIGITAQLKTEKYSYLMKEWNDAHVNDVNSFLKLYNDTVYFYGESIEGKSAAALKEKALSNDKSYKQEIKSLRIIEVNDHYIQCYFEKVSTAKGTTKKYPSFVTWIKKGDTWLIRSENDLYSEMAVAKKKYKMKTPNNYKENVDWGDFRGDKTIQCAWVEGAHLINEDAWDDGCIGECDSYVRFSNPDIPSIKIENCIWGDVINLGDLNLNETTEIGVVPHWPSSCWSLFYVFTLIDGKWEKVFNPVISTHCSQFENGDGFPVKPNESYNGKVQVTYTTMVNMGTEASPDPQMKVIVKEIDTATKKYNVNIYGKEVYR